MAHDRDVYMHLHDCQGGWYCKFLEVDLMTAIPKHLGFSSNENLVEMAQRGGELGSRVFPSVRSANQGETPSLAEGHPECLSSASNRFYGVSPFSRAYPVSSCNVAED